MGFLAGLSTKDENLLLLANSKLVELITTTTAPSTNPNRIGITFFFLSLDAKEFRTCYYKIRHFGILIILS